MGTDEYCEYCGEEMIAEFVDVGIGGRGVQVTESYCYNQCDYNDWLKEREKETNE